MNISFTLPAAAYVREEMSAAERAELEGILRAAADGVNPPNLRLMGRAGDGELYVIREKGFSIVLNKDFTSDQFVVISVATKEPRLRTSMEVASLAKAAEGQ